MEAPYKVAVIGLGYFSQFHLDAWRDIADTELCGVFDLDAVRTQEIAAEYRTKTFQSVEDLTCEQLDIIDIVAPPPAHKALIETFASDGRVIICQKPFCTSLKEAEAVAALAKKRGCTLIIHENFRFQPWYREIKSVLESGELGHVYQARFALRPGDGRGKDAYLSRQPAFRTMDRLLIHETGVHFVDLFQFLFGDIQSVYADIENLNPVLAGEDAGVMLMQHTTGTRTMLDGNRLLDHAAENTRHTMGEMEIEAENGTLRLDGFGKITMRKFGELSWSELPVSEPIDDIRFGGGCVEALNRHVVAALNGTKKFENTAAEYLSVIRVTDAAYVSAETATKQTL
ncbi:MULTISPECIES: Gfo/Idh/MocA family protein [Halocynthiibacter]|uniref:Gfo/Idh/MocA family oxidoreductase n=1 Tax=Halocynthiibacter halioticoli TaxID=2986804 RepID=A0AAE3J2A3_9RHOB|nr:MULTISPECIES: Gfo/Idh/MocA family oxidoreductase [Halocynthiibacter]MCV6825366.1 Gfo/Idh/MocA family oxidoreductase [Halocynthiibacter halioticoli]MCW4058367.1 Gfo/Idh/MocA family oxidoreductase [Halocynthiibacter sp. SDUM655004]